MQDDRPRVKLRGQPGVELRRRAEVWLLASLAAVFEATEIFVREVSGLCSPGERYPQPRNHI